ncbi:Thiamin pyrophosphokinase catalytic domain-containing protein [Desulfotomaculum nigrificans CO-1-SRB]|uniref:Thiamin pyrophosphokinase catalytic domain-containing protein n=1 Tax=Desulfotomaculum nigrificans (strain DSM 14880 / VKM B-2319 / CO-1-SRB) TaxID=868595 RepID=F6B9N3_DESCC|nr:putative cytokinetic ring protein SteA [Desulfotomaculum nigrificans]AEF94929.1 Thiamin pyrophosphokinase catalytic domain-containing protein [Desulfotomaculum nigrificans CO-1-SRB]
MSIKGIARVDKKTKNLTKRIQHNEIAVICHHELDKVAADSLIAAKVRAVINAVPSLSDDYPNLGPITLLEAGIPILDAVGEEIMELVSEGDELEIRGSVVFKKGVAIAEGIPLTIQQVKEHMEQSRGRMDRVLSRFIHNTLDYARNEVDFVCGGLSMPEVATTFKGRHTLIVVRGHNYKEDLMAIKSYIDEVHPVLVGVDGGADALMEFGYTPDLIIGDMDSITDKALCSGAELVVHAYPDGRAPGLARVESLGLQAKIFPAPGTSEDIAMMLAYEKGTELIVAVGTHSNMLDFLEKGRKGMASTFLVRLKVGDILVDAKGVSQLYRNRLKMKYVGQILLAGLVPLAVVIAMAPPTRELFRLLVLNVRLIFGV